MLEQLYKNHNKNCNILKKMGCPNDIAQDFVQEMYIRIHNYSQVKEIKSVDVCAFFILRNLFYDYCRKKKREVSYDSDYINIDRIDTSQEEFNLEEEITKSDNLAKLEELLNDPNVISWYDKKILLEHYKEGIPMRKIGRETNIGFPSIYNTVKKSREQLKRHLDEYKKQ